MKATYIEYFPYHNCYSFIVIHGNCALMIAFFRNRRSFRFVLSENCMDMLDAARRMDREALVKIFDIYSPALYNYVFRLSKDSVLADNIVGDVFVKLLEQLSAGKGPTTNLRSYLYEMAYHFIVNEVRYSQRLASLEEVDLRYRDGPSTKGIVLEDKMLFETVLRSIMNDLTVNQRHVIVLRFLEGFSLKETAKIVGKKVGNVKVIQNRAIAVLRRTLDYSKAQTTDIPSISFNFVRAWLGSV